MSIQLIIGLANPGVQYENTRHNAGAWYITALCDQLGVTLKTTPKLFASVASAVINGHKIRLAIPNTYMNESGKAIQALASYYKLAPEALLIAHDELDLEPGIIRLKHPNGGHGGHNGLRDIQGKIQSKGFFRLRIGIGHPGNKKQVSNYVLKQPSHDDAISIQHAIIAAISITPLVVAGDIQNAMTTLHTTAE